MKKEGSASSFYDKNDIFPTCALNIFQNNCKIN